MAPQPLTPGRGGLGAAAEAAHWAPCLRSPSSDWAAAMSVPCRSQSRGATALRDGPGPRARGRGGAGAPGAGGCWGGEAAADPGAGGGTAPSLCVLRPAGLVRGRPVTACVSPPLPCGQWPPAATAWPARCHPPPTPALNGRLRLENSLIPAPQGQVPAPRAPCGEGKHSLHPGWDLRG